MPWLTLLLFLTVSPAAGHIMSMSSGELRVADDQAHYELWMPLYEVIHLEEPETELLENFKIYAEGRLAERLSGSCVANSDQGTYHCEASYKLAAPTDRLDVECTFAAVTVPNHVHVLKALRGGVTKQAVFDFSFARASIRFTPPTESELAYSQMSAGLSRVLLGPFQILFLLALVLAGRSRRELLGLAAAFVAAEALSAVIVAATSWQPPARFVEAAAALTVAYLAIEILVLPEAGYRWLVAAGVGVFHGFYFGNFLRQSGMDSFYVLSGAILAEAVLLVVFAFLLGHIKKVTASQRPVQVGAVLLFITGMVWFVLRVRT